MKDVIRRVAVASACCALVLPFQVFAKGGAGTATPVTLSGSGGTKQPLSFSSSSCTFQQCGTNAVVASGVPVAQFTVTATSGVNQPTITLTSSSFPEVTLAGVSVFPSGKFG